MRHGTRTLRGAAALLVASATLKASAAELVVQWAPGSGSVDGYQVERRVGEAGQEFAPVARVGGEATSFLDRGVTSGVRYCYRVRGVRGERTSLPSPELCGVAVEPSPETVEAEPEPAAPLEPGPPPEVQPPPASARRAAPSGQDREPMPLRRPAPVYPREAQLRGISGYVRLRFTVTAEGRTRDIEVVAAEPPGVFERSAIDAAQRFVYAPRLENGVAVDRSNVETDITFTWIDRGGDLITDRR